MSYTVRTPGQVHTAAGVYTPDPWNNLPSPGLPGVPNQPAPINGMPGVMPGFVQVPAGHPFAAPVRDSAALIAAFDPKRAGRAKTAHVVLVLDESGSMMGVWSQTLASANEFVKGQADDVKTSGIPTKVSVYKFDGGNLSRVRTLEDVTTFRPLTQQDYQPRGSTNLLDAMGGVMMQVANDLKALPKAERGSVMIVTMTDGEENSSRTFDNAAIKGMVEKAEAKDWGFMFMGANIDAFAVGGQLGMQFSNTLSYSTRNMDATLKSATRMANSFKGLVASGADVATAYAASAFTDAERTMSAKGD